MCYRLCEDESLTLSQSTVAQQYGTVAVQEMEETAKNATVVTGKSLAIVEIDGKEVCLKKDSKGKYNCVCNVFKKVFMCSHVVALAKHNGTEQEFVQKNAQNCLSQSALRSHNKDAGKKPNQNCGRKGSRLPKLTPYSAHCKLTQTLHAKLDSYMVIRHSRQTVCNGCKGSLRSEIFIIRHHCSIPFHKNVDGSITLITPRPSNHHFHLRRACVLKSPHHTNFDGLVHICPTVFLSHQLKSLCLQGDLHIADP